MHLRLKYFFLFIFASLFLAGQDLSSLQNKLKTTSGKEKVDLYLSIGNILCEQYGKPDSLLYYGNLAYNEAGKLNYKEGMQQAVLGMAVGYQKKDQHDTAISILTKLLAEVEKGKDRKLIADIKYNLGLNFRNANNFKLATDYYLKAISIYQEIKDTDGMAVTHGKLAGVFTLGFQFDLALPYARKAIGLLPEVKSPFTKITILSSISGVYNQLGTKDKKMIDSAIYFSKMALDLAEEHHYYTKLSPLSISICNGYTLKKDHKRALEYCKRAITYRNFMYPFEIVTIYINFSDCYFNLKEYKSSLIYLDSARIILKELKDPFFDMAVEERAHVYNQPLGNFEAALNGMERYSAIKDSLYDLDKSKALNELEQKYNRSENEKKISELNKENEIASLNVKFLVVGVLASLLIIIVIVFFYRQSVLKNKFKALETEQRLNRARMNPHFFFNALASIQTLSMDAENQSKVSSLISKFSKIMRQSLESTYDELATIEDEVLFISNYLDLQKTRFNNKFDYEISVDDNLPQDELKIPSMLLQPFLENSIEHGFKSIDYKGKLDIIFRMEENRISIELKDNGTGFDTTQKHKEYPSRATQIIADRLMILNKQHKSNADYQIVANKEGKGVCVLVHLPFIY